MDLDVRYRDRIQLRVVDFSNTRQELLGSSIFSAMNFRAANETTDEIAFELTVSRPNIRFCGTNYSPISGERDPHSLFSARVNLAL